MNEQRWWQRVYQRRTIHKALATHCHSQFSWFFLYFFFSFFLHLFCYHQFHECFQHKIKTCLKMCVHSLHNFFLCQLFASFHFALKILHAFSSSKKEQRPPFAQSVVHCFVGFHMKCLEELCSCVSTFASNSSCSFVMWMISQGFERTFAFFFIICAHELLGLKLVNNKLSMWIEQMLLHCWQVCAFFLCSLSSLNSLYFLLLYFAFVLWWFFEHSTWAHVNNDTNLMSKKKHLFDYTCKIFNYLKIISENNRMWQKMWREMCSFPNIISYLWSIFCCSTFIKHVHMFTFSGHFPHSIVQQYRHK